MRKMDISSINISKSFASSHPSEKKMNECREYWNQHHKQDRYIVLDFDNNLIDGYVQYLVLEENGISEAEVKISDRRKKRWYRKNIEDWCIPHYRNEDTTYIYGMHFNKKKAEFSKEYMWRVPKSWSEAGWESDLLPGDDIVVSTKYGLKTIVVTKIVRTNECPADCPVRRVVKKVVNER